MKRQRNYSQLKEQEKTLVSIESVMSSNHVIFCCPLLLLLSVFPSIRVFSSESTLLIRWPKYWSFSFSIGSSSKYSELISLNFHPLDQKSQNKHSNPSFAMIVLIGKWRMEILSYNSKYGLVAIFVPVIYLFSWQRKAEKNKDWSKLKREKDWIKAE